MINRQSPAPKVNLSVGGFPVPAQTPVSASAPIHNRVEYYPHAYQKQVHAPYYSYQPQIAPTSSATPIQRYLPQNRQYMTNISTKVTTPGSIENNSFDNRYHNFSSHHHNWGGSFQRQRYGVDQRNNDQLSTKQRKIKSEWEHPNKEAKFKNEKQRRPKKGSKFCGPILWAILGLILVALFFVALLFMFGVFDLNGPYHPHQQNSLTPSNLQSGVNYHEGSVTIQTATINNYGKDGQQSDKDDSGYSTILIPKAFSAQTNSLSTNQVAVNLRAYDDFDLQN